MILQHRFRDSVGLRRVVLGYCTIRTPLILRRRPNWAGWTGLLISIGIIYAFTDGWFQNRNAIEQTIVWAVGGVCAVFGLARLIPYRHERKFAFFGYFAVFACLFSLAYTLIATKPPQHIPHPMKAVPNVSRIGIPQEVAEVAGDTLERISELTDPVPREAAQPQPSEQIEGRVVGISDGDTLTLLVGRTQHKIRLGEIDTPESGQPWGKRARQALAEKVHRQSVRVDITDRDRYGRLVGKVWLGERDINRELVREGHAWVYRRYMEDRSLLRDERAAKKAKVGLWSMNNPIEPWAWRRGER